MSATSRGAVTNPLSTIRKTTTPPRSMRRLDTPRRRIAFDLVESEPDNDASSTDLEEVELGAAATPARGARPPREFREHVLDRFYLHDAGDRETVRLLMRGMPLPVCYGFPGTDGTFLSNAREFVYLFHPLVSVFKVHPLCPFTAKERLVVFFCSVAFNFVWTAFTEYHRLSIVSLFGRADPESRGLGFYLVKHTATILYAVLIRQIVICPCLYKPLIDAACEDDAPVGPARGVGARPRSRPASPPRLDDRKLARRAARLKRWKLRGDRGIMLLVLGHAAVVFAAIYFLAASIRGAPYLDGDDVAPKRHNAAKLIFVSEVVNFWFWFVKFAPLFLLLYPIHRAQWFQGGTLADYLVCRKRCCGYTRAAAYKDPTYPRCVRPETHSIPEAGLGNISSLARSGSLSTIRRKNARDVELSARRVSPEGRPFPSSRPVRTPWATPGERTAGSAWRSAGPSAQGSATWSDERVDVASAAWSARTGATAATAGGDAWSARTDGDAAPWSEPTERRLSLTPQADEDEIKLEPPSPTPRERLEVQNPSSIV